jgi:DNA polymerase III epsilon subunit-like protein
MDTRQRSDAIYEAQAMIESNPVYLDTETTGLGKYDQVIEIGLVDDQGNVLFDQLVKTHKKIDPAAGRVHGITEKMLESAPTWESVWSQAEAILMNRRIGVYNVEFDVRLIKQSHYPSGIRWSLPEENFFDIMKLYARFYGDRDPYHHSYRYQSLEQAGRQCGIRLPNSHRAVDDCLLARALLHHIAKSV